MSLEGVLGLPLEEALTIMRGMGYEPIVKKTSAPKGQREGQLRVVRARPEEITVSVFLTEGPAKRQAT